MKMVNNKTTNLTAEKQLYAKGYKAGYASAMNYLRSLGLDIPRPQPSLKQNEYRDKRTIRDFYRKNEIQHEVISDEELDALLDEISAPIKINPEENEKKIKAQKEIDDWHKRFLESCRG